MIGSHMTKHYTWSSNSDPVEAGTYLRIDALFPFATAHVTSGTVRSPFQSDTVRSSSPLTNLTSVALRDLGVDVATAGTSMSAATPWCA